MRIFHRVIEQIVHDFFEPPFICAQRGKVVGNLQFKPEIFSGQTFRPVTRHRLQKFAQFDFVEL